MFLTSIVGAVCVVLFVVTVTLGILLSWQRRGLGEYCDELNRTLKFKVY